MGNIPLTPIVGQANPLFSLNGLGNPQAMSFPDLIQPQPVIAQPTVGMQMGQPTTVLEVPMGRPYQGGKNTVLEIRKIPRELNNMVKLGEHFQKFGTITKLQVRSCFYQIGSPIIFQKTFKFFKASKMMIKVNKKLFK